MLRGLWKGWKGIRSKRKENKISVIIERPVKEVFEFTTNPKNTSLWIDSIIEEVLEGYPPMVGSVYKNRGEDSEWDSYKVLEFEQNKIFTLGDLDRNYHVRYTYVDLGDDRTEMEYFEWIKDGDLSKPFTEDILLKLKEVIENN